jgi:hypothetical protein
MFDNKFDPEDLNKYSKSSTENFTTKYLIPFGSILVGVMGLLASGNTFPIWVYIVISLYLVIILLISLFKPVKKLFSKSIKNFTLKKFSTAKRKKLQELAEELKDLFDEQKTTTIPYIITHNYKVFQDELNTLNCVANSREQFLILQSWTLSSCDNLKNNSHSVFLRDAAEFSNIINWFSRTYNQIRTNLNNEFKGKDLGDIIIEWNNASLQILDFTNRSARIMKAINQIYDSSICCTHFQEIKQL